jgi:hypothetical protein
MFVIVIWSNWDFPQFMHFGDVPLSGSATNNLHKDEALDVPYPTGVVVTAGTIGPVVPVDVLLSVY